MTNNFNELLKTFYTLEKACDTLYKFVMTEKSRLDELTKRVEVLENEKDNSR